MLEEADFLKEKSTFKTKTLIAAPIVEDEST